MCEWLSCGEWCDVKLVCGGRTFNAHRAVLASVSAFLRRVLLSCPQEDTPTFIVLPDFDLDAMSSVLYYVYNGEVVIEKHKLLLFLDIVKTLEIFIDHQYLQKLRDKVDGRYLDLHIYRKSKYLDKVFTLGSGNCSEHECVKIRKGERVHNKRLQYLQSDLDHCDNRNTCRNRSNVHPSDNSAPYGDRQRNSFLRDLYIETYPQNGNVNGLTGGVLAISNELYRAPTSVLLTNANGILPNRVDNRLSVTSAKVNDYISFLPNMSRKQRCIQDFGEMPDQINSKRFLDTHWNSLDLSQSKLYIGNSCSLSIDNRKPLVKLNPPYCYTQLLPRESQEMHPLNTSSIDLSMTQSIAGSVVPNEYDSSKNRYVNTISLLHNKLNNNSKNSHSEEDSSHNYNFIKAPIFNQVIESPWRPRLPNNYKPFRRKGIDGSNSAPPNKEYDVETVNDNNNNIEQDISQAKCVENASSVTGEDFKCDICSQVFTSDDCLSVHMKRHTTPPRYSCGECGKTFSQLRNFKYHMSVHRGTREFAATCTVCGKYFNDRGYLSSHMKIHRNRKEYKCTMCPKSFNQRVAYNMHVRIHTGVKPHVCEQCGKAFSRKMLLKQHQRTHSGERPYACPHCDKRFADRSNMTLHLRLHTGVKPFSCSLCPKSFTKKHHLKSHLNFHTGAKPYACPRCKLAFTQSSNMRTHLKKCSAPEENTLAM